MARFYADENVPTQVVVELRRLGHDVLTSLEAGNANRSIPDQEVIAFAVSQTRILLTLNRRHFLRLHQRRAADHSGIVACTFDPDFDRQALRIHEAIEKEDNVNNSLIRVNRPA